MRFFDTHAHLNNESFNTDRAALIEGLPSCGAELIMDVACAVEDFEKTLEITAEYTVYIRRIRHTSALCVRSRRKLGGTAQARPLRQKGRVFGRNRAGLSL